jgi:hypothetical protein
LGEETENLESAKNNKPDSENNSNSEPSKLETSELLKKKYFFWSKTIKNIKKR